MNNQDLQELRQISDSIDGVEKSILYDDKSKKLTFENTKFISLDFDTTVLTVKYKTYELGSPSADKEVFNIGDVKNIHFKNCENDIIRFKGGLNNIVIDDSFFDKVEFYIENKCKKISITNSHFKEKLKIRNPEKDKESDPEKPKFELESLKIKDCTIGKEAYLRLGFLDCDEFVLSNLRNPKDAEVNIGECIFEKFHLTNFRNMGKFKIFNTENIKGTKGTKFQIDNTSIGDADFQNINLRSFNKVILYDNIFYNLHYTNIKWKDSIEITKYNDAQDLLEKQQDIYRTLKNVATMNNDRPQALIFFANEMRSYKKLVLQNKNKYSTSDIWTLKFNECTNNFGLSWLKPFGCLLALSFISYCLLLYNIDVSENMSENIVGKFFVFINPIHKVEFIYEGCWNSSSYIIDSIFRALEGLLIYQMIQGFRKYSRNL